jgi:hypothetical protein
MDRIAYDLALPAEKEAMKRRKQRLMAWIVAQTDS